MTDDEVEVKCQHIDIQHLDSLLELNNTDCTLKTVAKSPALTDFVLLCVPSIQFYSGQLLID